MPSTTIDPPRWRQAAVRIDAATPAGRDRSLDAYRALAILGVVAGHWLIGALVLGPDGALAIASPLSTIEALAPASWFLQMLGLFFLVGGYAATTSLDRAQTRGIGYGGWLQQRLVRMGRPVLAAVAMSALAIGALALLGVPAGKQRTWVILFIQPLWFVLVYGLATVLTRFAIAADRRFGGWAALLLAAVIALGDLLRYGPWHDVVPAWVGLVNILPGWLFGYQLGISWARGRLRAAGWPMLVAGLALFALLLVDLGYPASMVGIPGVDRSNANPPSLLVIALAAVQAGAAIVLRDRVTRLMRRPAVWAVVAMINAAAMTIFCWHQVPLVLVSLGGAAVDGLPGLTDDPTHVGWILARLPWLVVMAGVLVAVVACTRSFERPWSAFGRHQRVLLGVLAAGFVGWVVALY